MAGGVKTRGELNGRYIARGAAGEKVCTECGAPRPIESFKVDRSRFDGRGYICAGCRDRQRMAPGPSIRLRKQQALSGLAWCSGCMAWKSKAGIRAGKCRACVNAADRARYANDSEFRKRRQRRSMLRRGVGAVPPVGSDLLTELFDGQCAYCPAMATTWDHVVAVTKGGVTEPSNIVPACARCNSSKRTQNVWTWLQKTGRTPHPAFYDRLELYHLQPTSGPDPWE